MTGTSSDGDAQESTDGDDDRESAAGSDAHDSTEGNDADDPLAELGRLDGWQVEGYAGRVHYQGAGDHYSIEYYAPSDCVLYWKVKGDGETAVPVGRDTVPEPLRTRIREDLADAGIDPEVEARTL